MRLMHIANMKFHIRYVGFSVNNTIMGLLHIANMKFREVCWFFYMLRDSLHFANMKSHEIC